MDANPPTRVHLPEEEDLPPGMHWPEKRPEHYDQLGREQPPAGGQYDNTINAMSRVRDLLGRI